jgi:Berberine and berberine like
VWTFAAPSRQSAWKKLCSDDSTSPVISIAGSCCQKVSSAKRARSSSTVHPHAYSLYLIPSAYSNYLTDEGEAITREAYGANYERLVALKKKYDPTNFFRMNHNIKPG